MGCKIKSSGPILYVAGEGVAGVADRVKAWIKINAPGREEELNRKFITIENVPNLTLNETDAFVRQNIEFAPTLLILDTLARCSVGGDENSALDMGKLISESDKLKRAFGCPILLAHHTGKNGDMRGSTALPGGIDFSFEIKKLDGVRSFNCKKMKDGSDAFKAEFKLMPTLLGEDEDGDEITSCTILQVQDGVGVGQSEAVTSQSKVQHPRGQWQILVLACVSSITHAK